jgi:hypothetical protein
MNLKKTSILPIPMYYLETAKGYTGKEIVQKAGNESTRYKRAPLRTVRRRSFAVWSHISRLGAFRHMHFERLLSTFVLYRFGRTLRFAINPNVVSPI